MQWNIIKQICGGTEIFTNFVFRIYDSLCTFWIRRGYDYGTIFKIKRISNYKRVLD